MANESEIPSRASRVFRLTFVFALTTLAGFATPLLQKTTAIGLDWDYFSSLSLVVRSNILHYGRIPLHDPWVAGGLDIFANPQNRIFSPTGLLDLILTPYAANLASLIIYAFAGMIGMYTLLRGQRISQQASTIGAILFVNCSWFGLHFSEGHIPYGSFQLMPWVLHFALTLKRSRSVFFLLSLLGFFLLDGGMYPFIFSLLLLGAGSLIGLIKPWEAFTGKTRQELSWLALTTLAITLMASAKIIPVLAMNADRQPWLDFTALTLPQLGKIFFYPFQSLLDPLGENSSWRFHEFGCYLGFGATLVLLTQIFRPTFLKTGWRYIALGGFFFWIASGWGGDYNPWHLFQKIPLINNAHVQSRLFLLMFLCFVILVAKALDGYKINNRYAWMILGVILAGEATFAKAYPFHSALTMIGKPKPEITLIQSESIRETVGTANKPDHYFTGNFGARQTYEPAAPRTAVSYRGLASYRGEIYVTSGQGSVALQSFTPGRIEFAYEASEPLVIEANTNFLQGWKTQDPRIRVHATSQKMVGIEVPAGSGRAVVTYSPRYLNGVLLSFLGGLILWFTLLVRDPNRTDHAMRRS